MPILLQLPYPEFTLIINVDIISQPQQESIGGNQNAVHRKSVFIDSFFRQLNSQYGLVASYSRIELGINSEIIQQNILLFQACPKMVWDERRLVAELVEISKDRFMQDDYFKMKDFKIESRDFSELIASIDKKFPKNNIVSNKNITALQKFEYWYLGYFCLIDHYLKPDILYLAEPPYIFHCYIEGFISESVDTNALQHELPSGTISELPTQSRTADREYLDDYDPDKSIEKIVYVPKTVKHELELICSLYSKYIELLKRPDDDVNLFFLIEYFSRVVQHNSSHNLTNNLILLDEKKAKPHRYFTLAEKLFIAIHLDFRKNKYLYFQREDKGLIGWRIKSFLEVYELCYVRDDSFFTNLHSYMEQFKYENSSAGINKDLLKQEALESIKVKKNADAAKVYLKQKIKSDIFILRFDFSYESNSNFTAQQNAEAFNLLFADFLKNLKRTQIDMEKVDKTASETERVNKTELIAHMGVRFFYLDELHIDVTFIFDAKQLSDIDEDKNDKMIGYVNQEIIKAWKAYSITKKNQMNDYDKKIFDITSRADSKKRQKAETTKFRGIIEIVNRPLVNNIPINFPEHIKYHDHKNLRNFKKETINFYTSHALLCTWKTCLENLKEPVADDSNWLNMEQFIKGRLPKKKKKISEGEVEVEQKNAEASKLSMSDAEDINQSPSSEVESVLGNQGEEDKRIESQSSPQN
ncbi:MAG: hypothetical protein E7I55_14465 [Acinetobacter ursingii]|nr:hypothetical protein [Acinetobacter ursingii]